MAKKSKGPPKGPPKDPWEDQEDLVPAKLAQPPAVVDDVIEVTDFEISEEDGDENWVVKYSGDKPPTKRDLEARKNRITFLETLMKTGNATLAAARSGVGWRAHYLARDRHPDFARNWDMAVAIYHTFVANEKIRKRALDGIRKPVWYQGKIVGYEIQLDSGLTQFYMKSAMPDVYGDKRELKIEGGLTFGIALLPTALGVEQWQQQAIEVQKNIKVIDITPNQQAKEPAKQPATAPEIGRG